MKFVYIIFIILTPYGVFKNGTQGKPSQAFSFYVSENKNECERQRIFIENSLGKGPNIVETVCILGLKVENNLADLRKSYY